MPNQDLYGRLIYTEKELLELIHCCSDLNLGAFYLDDSAVEQYNNAISKNFSDLELLHTAPKIDQTPEQWHCENQKKWFVPESYKETDIARYILDQCENETELQRAGAELFEYAERGLLPLLTYLKYLVDTMRENSIVWGVGRGSSVSSFVLYKLGLHHINSIEHDLDFAEFMR